jgi:hypothetical protein
MSVQERAMNPEATGRPRNSKWSDHTWHVYGTVAGMLLGLLLLNGYGRWPMELMLNRLPANLSPAHRLSILNWRGA